MKIIRIVSLADGRQSPIDGAWLIACDIEAREGRGMVSATEVPTKAKTFPDLEAAHTYWTRQSVTVPLRPDGKPNRPLTAYTIDVVDV